MSRKNKNMTEEELRDYEYEDMYEIKQKRKKIIGIVIIVVVLLLIIFLCLRSCMSGTTVVEVSENEKNLLEAGKEYFNKNYEEMPTAIGSCEEVTLEKLLLEGLLKKDNFRNCHGKDTKVKVCILENEKEQWTPFLTCDEINTEFSEWQEGKPKDLVKDQSDVRFEFMGKILDIEDAELGDTELYWQDEVPYDAYKTNEVTEYYSYRDKMYIWNLNEKRYYPGDKTSALAVKEYYVSSPASGYNNKDSGTNNAYKYYKNGSKQYWNNGGYSVTNPGGGYDNKDSGVNVTVYRTRKWNKQSDVTVKNSTIRYMCGRSDTSIVKVSLSPCNEQEDGFTINKGSYYTCNGSDKVSAGTKCYTCPVGTLRSDKSSCGNYTSYGSYTATKCDTSSDLCDSTTVSTYKWYKYTKSYYPGNALYTTAPASGYYKDGATRTTAYKWYKLLKVGESTTLNYAAPNALATYTGKTTWGPWTSYSVTKPAGSTNTEVQKKNQVSVQKVKGETKDKWQDLSKDYVSEKELIELFNKKNLNVKTLEDIMEKNGEAKYTVKMYYRNRL